MEKFNNKVQLTGNLGATVVLKEVGDKKVATVSIGLNERYSKDGNDVERVYWINLTAWGDQADKLATYGKGDLIAITGKLITESYTKDDKPHYTTKVVVFDSELVYSK